MFREFQRTCHKPCPWDVIVHREENNMKSVEDLDVFKLAHVVLRIKDKMAVVLTA
jgi:uncharacterized protein YdcH (DUF465 family)